MLVQFPPLELIVVLFLDISPVIKLLSWFRKVRGHNCERTSRKRCTEGNTQTTTLLLHFFYCKLMVTAATECKKTTKPPVTEGHRNPGYLGGLLMAQRSSANIG